MKADMFERVSVIGAGTMGAQIALHCATHGRRVSLYSRTEKTLKLALEGYRKALDRRVQDGRLVAGDGAGILDRIRTTTDLAECVDHADLVIENAPEDLEVKRELFSRLEVLCSANTILATNSSSLCISRIESVTKRQDRVLNLHFVTPVQDGAVVELMRGTATSDDTMARIEQFSRSLELVPLMVQKESRGFILGRVWRALKNECLQVADEGVASPEDVDRGWMIMTGMPIGPFGLMDVIGLDVVRDVEMTYHHELADESGALPQVLLDKVDRGELGVKTGKGFYTYPDPAFQAPGWLQNKQG